MQNAVVVQSVPMQAGHLGSNGYTQNNTAINTAVISIDTNQVSGQLLMNVMVHEIGHNYGLGDCTACSNTVMAYPIGSNTPVFPTGCDDNNVYDYTQGTEGEDNACTTAPSACAGLGATCSSVGNWDCNCAPIECPTGFPICDPNSAVSSCSDGSVGCPLPAPAPCCSNCYVYCTSGGWFCEGSPIALDLSKQGFHFTNVAGGVKFRVTPGGSLYQMSWPERGRRN